MDEVVGRAAVGRVEAAPYAGLCSATLDWITLLSFRPSRDTWIYAHSFDTSTVSQTTPPLTLCKQV